MQYILMVLCLLGAVAGMVFIKSLNLSGGLTVALVVPLVFVVVYFLARIQTSDRLTVQKIAKK